LFIWEERIKRKPGTSHELIKVWSKIASLDVKHDRITTIKFSPEHAGLKLLVLFKNGRIKVFHAKNVNILSKWDLIADLGK
jgi:hypothetical protein